MPLSYYVSAEWNDPGIPGMKPNIKAIGDDGLEYWLPGDTPITYDVPPWPAFVESEVGRAFLAQTPPEPQET